MNRIYINRTIRFIIVIGIIILACLSFYYLIQLTYPFLIGLAIAFFMNPIVYFFEKKGRMPRGLAVILALVIIIALFAGLVTLLVTEIVSGANYLGKVVPQNLGTLIDYIDRLIVNHVIPFYNHLTNAFNKLDPGQKNTIMDNFRNFGNNIGTTAGSFIKNLFSNIPNILSWFPQAATALVFSLLATFFISKDWDKLSAIGGKLLPDIAKSNGKTVFIDLKKALFGFIRTQFTLMSITAVIVLIGLLILRIDYAITIALITGICEIIPYVGTAIIFVPWIIYEIFSGDMGLAIGLGVTFIVGIVIRQIIEPKILSSSIGIDPFATLVALFVGFKLIGFTGLILGPVILVIISTLHRANVLRDIWTFIKGKEAK